MTLSIISSDRDITPWQDALKAIDPSLDIQVWPDEADKSQVEFALCWKHPPGVLRDYPNLRCICSMGAGVDHLLEDPQLPPEVPVIRLVDPQLAASMFEYLSTVVMYYFRDFDRYQAQQREARWEQQAVRTLSQTRIGIMGLGELGGHAATGFAAMGFRVAGWSRSKKMIPNVTAYAGNAELAPFLGKTDILICLLPLTAETRGILCLENFSRLPGGTCLVNVARGEHLVDEDLIPALEQGLLRGACLDVFREEPLPPRHPFWSDSRILVTPHCSSITDPASVAPQIIENYRAMKSGGPLSNRVDIARGY